ncbi:site-specific integrase [Patulibacter brassicae]|uniref:Site-specific integrase n=1 Tax=Patulibacter brassicae TaxID=1705717 RepID=A0ABU4VH10_9ACTN|nr:site-specific integrase [Patulibacter brassicae]MDX8151073.1 site-specific integrase [Patulibacter brassicae]
MIERYTLKNGATRWRAREWDPLRRRYVNVSSGHTSERAAKKSHREWVAAGGMKTLLRARSRITLAEIHERWLELAELSDSTRAVYRNDTKRFVEKYGRLRPGAVERVVALEWKKQRPRDVAALSAMWSWATAAELIPGDHNPWAGLVQKQAGRDLEPGWLLMPDVVRLLALPPVVLAGTYGTVWTAVIGVAAFVGLRPGEIAGLRWDDLRPDEGLIHVQRQYNGKTRTFTLPKHGHKRFVAYPAQARALVDAMPRMHDERVFNGVRGGVLSPGVRDRAWHPIRAAFGRPDMDLYELRHFCATWLREEGASASDVAEQLGHQDGGKLVLKTYGHPRANPALNRIRALMEAVPTNDAQEATA